MPPPDPCEVLWEDYKSAIPGKPPCLGRHPMAKGSNKAFKATVAMVSCADNMYPVEGLVKMGLWG